MNGTKLFLCPLLCSLIVGCYSGRHRAAPATLGDVGEMIRQHRTRDLRGLFLPEDKIHALEARRACLILAPWPATGSREIVVGDGEPLDRVVQQSLGKEYDGQIKVVSRDSITQTPQATYEPERQKTIRVSSGDLVFVLGRD